MNKLKHFSFFAQKIIPLVYDDSLSYYELLCKVFKVVNDIIGATNELYEDNTELRNELAIVKQWINNYDTSFIEEVINNYLARGIYVEISDAGYFIYYIPEGWKEIMFETTGYDVNIGDYDYGHLVLSY